MEQIPGSPLDDIFKGILNDETLQEQVKLVQEQKRREQEREDNKGSIKAGQNAYDFLSGKLEKLDDWSKNYQQDVLLDGFPTVINQNQWRTIRREDLTSEYAKAVRNFFQSGERKSQRPDLYKRHYLYGFGMKAMESSDLVVVLYSLDTGGWLDDKIEGPQIETQLKEVLNNLPDSEEAKVKKVQAVLAWKEIRENKTPAQPAPQSPPATGGI